MVNSRDTLQAARTLNRERLTCSLLFTGLVYWRNPRTAECYIMWSESTSLEAARAAAAQYTKDRLELDQVAGKREIMVAAFFAGHIAGKAAHDGMLHLGRNSLTVQEQLYAWPRQD